MKRIKRAFILLVILAVCLQSVSIGVLAAEASSEVAVQTVPNDSYREYNELYKDALMPEQKIEIAGNQAKPDPSAQVSFGTYEGKDNCAIWENGEGKLIFSIDIPSDSRYCIGLNYYSVPGKGSSLEYSLYIDGKYPFGGCASISFPRFYKYSNDEFLRDTQNNELRPEQIDVPMWNFAGVGDETGMYNAPYSFFFTAGKHEITFKSLRDGIVISSLVLYQPEEPCDYEEYISQNPAEDCKGDTVVIEAEHPVLKTSPVLYPNADRSDPATSKSDPVKTRLNTIGGDNWTSRSQKIIWKFNVNESGYYKIGFRYKQNFLRGMSTYRELMIDGKIPFSEFEAVAFPYTSSWELASSDYRVYLSKGEHTLTLTPTLSSTADIVQRTESCVERLNGAYSQIIAITGTSPDMWRNYYLHEAIPELKEDFKTLYSDLKQISDDMYELTGTRGSESSLIDRICKQLKKFIKSQDAISEQLESYHSNVSSLSSWMLNLKDQKLALDTVYITPYASEFPDVKATFFEKVSFLIRSFVGAFFEDYSAIGNVYDGNSAKKLTVWTASGRDQADIIKELVDTDFVKKTGINVNLQLVQGTVDIAVLSGRGPDVSIGGASPVPLALRDAVVPLDKFSDYGETVAKYPATLLNPFSIKGHCYALPESINFDMMFYRTDIFERLHLQPPQTWEELYDVIEVLQRNNMNVGLPADLFQILVLQQGGRIYNHSLTSTELTSNTAYKSFQMWTEFFSQHGVPIVKDDYNRFRTGELPLTIITYDFYMKLYASAPEIRNLWTMTTLPHFENGESTAPAYETAAYILDAVENKDAAWEFLKWWTSAETQHTYSGKVESVFGIAGRYSSANPEAYSKVAWSADDLNVLEKQLSNIVGLPTVPGDYYVSRNITNAYEAVLYNKKNPREALKYWMGQTDSEMARRCAEFGVGEDNTYYE